MRLRLLSQERRYVINRAGSQCSSGELQRHSECRARVGGHWRVAGLSGEGSEGRLTEWTRRMDTMTFVITGHLEAWHPSYSSLDEILSTLEDVRAEYCVLLMDVYCHVMYGV
ncbi:hypothetical protein PENSPDRAFT_650686, partial [Peniophora sp. CONT]